LPGPVVDPSGVPSALADLPPLRFFVEFGRRYNERDIAGLLELFAADWRMVDYREGDWDGNIGGIEGARALIESVFAVSPDVRFKIDEVLACDARLIALRVSYQGRGEGGLGEFAYLSGYVAVIEHGLWARTSEYEHDDDAAMLARYRDLGGR
jgi:SnoaL-like protein